MICLEHAQKYCKDAISMIENYDKAITDQTETWICHHRLGLVHSRKELERLGLYENRPAEELIFLTPSEHKSLHGMHMSDETRRKIAAARKGKKWSDETKRKMSAAKKGEKNPQYGKTPSDETRRKLSEAMKGKPSPRKGKPFSDETKKKMSEAAKARWARRKAQA